MSDLIFYGLSTILIGLCALVAFNPYPVRSVLALIAAFVVTSVLWLGLGAEFLALALVFVYVGAVMALFLYVVFMLNVDFLPKKTKPILIYTALMGVFVVLGSVIYRGMESVKVHAMDIAAPSNTMKIGLTLFNDHWLAFELVGVVLLVAMIGAVSLVGSHESGAKYQDVSKQMKRTVKDSIFWMKK